MNDNRIHTDSKKAPKRRKRGKPFSNYISEIAIQNGWKMRISFTADLWIMHWWAQATGEQNKNILSSGTSGKIVLHVCQNVTMYYKWNGKWKTHSLLLFFAIPGGTSNRNKHRRIKFCILRSVSVFHYTVFLPPLFSSF